MQGNECICIVMGLSMQGILAYFISQIIPCLLLFRAYPDYVPSLIRFLTLRIFAFICYMSSFVTWFHCFMPLFITCHYLLHALTC